MVIDTDNLIIGQYYYYTYRHGDRYIVKYTGVSSTCSYINFYANGATYYVSRGSLGYVGESIREATQDEIDWLDACIEAGKVVPKEDIINIKNYDLW